MTTGWIEANNVVFRYELSGNPSNDVVILLHEMGGGIETWHAVVPELVADFHVLTLDQRGAGLSEKIIGEVTIDDFADDLEFLTQAIGLRPPYFLAGSAVGSAIAIRFAARSPQAVTAVVAFSPACGLAADKRDNFLGMTERLCGVGPRGLRPPAGTPRLLFPPELDVRDADIEFHEKFALSNDPRSLAAWQRMLADLQMEDSFAALDCPALFVGATFDPLRPPAATREIALKVRHGSYLELPTGHFAPWQTPKLVASTLMRFFHEQQTSERPND